VVRVDESRPGKYAITDFKDRLAALLAKIGGEFHFAPAGTDSRITLHYNMCQN
jgi:hypothetical protein